LGARGRAVGCLILIASMILMNVGTEGTARGSGNDRNSVSGLSESEEPAGGPPGPSDQSEFMIGTVHVGTVFPDSDGSFDSDYESWSSARVDTVHNEIRAGLDWWESQIPNGHLRFDLKTYGIQPTRYEPILRSSADDNLWIGEIMQNLGFTASNWMQRVVDANDNNRRFWGDIWSFTIFIVDSLNDPDGKFTDGLFGYAHYGGPFLVMTYDNDNWGINNMDKVTAHEIGHIFYATDEYDDPGEYGGYLNVREVDNSGCIMDDSSWCRSSGTTGQIGWLDSDSDGLLDPEDTTPTTIINRPSVPPMTNIVVTGTATDVALKNKNPFGGNDVTINTISTVEYRVDGGVWQTAQASDGAFNEWQEVFTFTIPSLSGGTHSVQTWAMNSVGNWQSEPTLLIIEVDTTPPSTQLSISGRTDSTGMYLTPAVVTLTAFDAGSGVKSTLYRVDSGTWTLYASPFKIRSRGLHTVEYYSIDNSGNAESIRQAAVRIDDVPPVVRFKWDPMEPVVGGSVQFDASDTTDNADTGIYLNYTWTIWRGSVVVARLFGMRPSWTVQEGSFTVMLDVTDQAGNLGNSTAIVNSRVSWLSGSVLSVTLFAIALLVILVVMIVTIPAMRRRKRPIIKAVYPPPYIPLPPPPEFYEELERLRTQGISEVVILPDSKADMQDFPHAPE